MRKRTEQLIGPVAKLRMPSNLSQIISGQSRIVTKNFRPNLTSNALGLDAYRIKLLRSPLKTSA